jgi:small conductance mechanosensitive channel
MEVDYAQYTDLGIEYGIKVFLALVIFVVGRWVARWLTNILEGQMGKRGMDPMVCGFVGNIGYAALLVFVIISALGQLGIETTSAVAILGAAGLAIGFALQDSLSNFAAGFLLIVFKPFKKGDFVEAGGQSGTVEQIELFTTTMKTPDNRCVIIPNGNITGSSIINYSSTGTRRIDLVIGCGYNDDLSKVKSVLESIIAAEGRLLAEPTPTIGVLELGDSSVNFAVRPWVNTADYWGVYFDLMEAIKVKFDQEGISIPYPQTDVHLHQQSDN